MQDANRIWQFGRWIARRRPGSARLSWTGGEISLGVRDGRIHSAEGPDVGDLVDRLACEPTDETDLLAAARELGRRYRIPETQAMGAAKEILQRSLHDWLMDPDRELDLDDTAPDAVEGATISITHALVELVLADTSGEVAHRVLPDRNAVLQRSPAFLELYAPLRLSEEADLIVAGITGSATAGDIADGSNHNAEEVLRLEAALVATGILEAAEPELPAAELDWPSVDVDDDEIVVRRKLPVWLIAAVAGLLIVIVAVLALVLFGGNDDDRAAVEGSGDWGVVVEMGCEPQDLQRMLRKRNLERKALRTVKADPTNGDTCFRLIWGSFPSREAAEAAIDGVPPTLVEDGFEMHVIEVSGDEADPAALGGGE